MRTLKTTCGYCLSVAMALGFLSDPGLLADEAKLDLRGDFNWIVGPLRSEVSVKREIPGCVGFTEGKDVAFKSEGKPFCIIALTLKAKKTGTFDLIPEFFLMRDGLQYRACHGIRIVEPKPEPRAAAFHPPRNASVWPGHSGDRISCKKGDSIVLELLFDHVWRTEQAELLVASRAATLLEPRTQEMHDDAGPIGARAVFPANGSTGSHGET